MGQEKFSDFTYVPVNELTLADIWVLVQGTTTKLNKRSNLGDLKTFLKSFERPLQKIIFVDPNGQDSSGVRGKIENPFATIGAALAVAGDGDWLLLLPGSHVTDENLAKIGMTLNYFLYKGASLELNHATDPAAFDNDVTTSLNIYGQGVINHSANSASNFLFSNVGSSLHVECDGLTIHKKIECNCTTKFVVKDFNVVFVAIGQKIFQGNLSGGGSVVFENTIMKVTGSDPGAVTLFDFTGANAFLHFKNFDFNDLSCQNSGARFATVGPVSGDWYVWYRDVRIILNSGLLFQATEDALLFVNGRNIFNNNFSDGGFDLSIFGDGEYIITNDAVYRHPILNTPNTMVGADADGNLVCLDANIEAIPRWKKYTITAATFAGFNVPTYDASLTAYLNPGEVIHAVKIKHSTSFTGGAVSAVTVEVGTASDTDKYATAFNILQPVADDTFQLSSAFYSENHGAISFLHIVFRATGGNVEDITQGSVDIWILVSKAV